MCGSLSQRALHKMRPRKRELRYFGVLPTLFLYATFLAGIELHALASPDRLFVGSVLSWSE